MLYWPHKVEDLEEKAKEFIVWIQVSKNLKYALPHTVHTTRLPVNEGPLELLQLDFFRPIVDEKGKRDTIW